VSAFCILNVLKQGDGVSPLFSNSALEQYSAKFANPRNTVICRRHVTAHRKITSRKGGGCTKMHIAININLQINTCTTSVQGHMKTKHTRVE
jgi:hypothetical protein